MFTKVRTPPRALHVGFTQSAGLFDMIDRFYTVPQVAGMLQTTQQKVIEIFDLHKFGNMIRIKEADVYDYINDLKSK